MPLNRRVDKRNVVIYTMEYYSAVKNSDILKFAGKWMKVEKNCECGNPDSEKPK